MAALRRFALNLLATSEYRPTPSSLKKIVGEEFAWYRSIKIAVNLSVELQQISEHPEIVRRVVKEFPQLSSSGGGITCGSNKDFTQEMAEGTAGDLGHLWEHVTAQAFDDVSSRLGYGDHQFVWFTSRNRRRSNKFRTIYNILCFHEIEPPPEFNGLESLTLGYMNALIEDKPFPINKRIQEFVSYRSQQ